MDESLNQPIEQAPRVDIDLRRAWATARNWAVAHVAELSCAVLLAVMSLQMLAVISRKSITLDEIVMIPSAYYHLGAGNFQIINEHPPLSKIAAGIPMLFIQPVEAKPGEDQWAYTGKFWEDNPDLFESLSFWPRVPMILLTVVLGLVVFKFARELFGALTAVLAVALFALEPTVLAHGRVVQTDIPAALGYLLLFFALYRYTQAPSLKRAAWIGASAGIALLTKYSMLLAGPIVLVFFAIMIWRARAKKGRAVLAHLAIVTVTALVVLNAGYLFQHRALESADVQWIQDSFPTVAGAVTLFTKLLAHVIPADFILGVLWQFSHNSAGHPAGLLGMHSLHGWWYYFPVAFALKATIPFLLLSIASLAWGTYQLIKKGNLRFVWLLTPFVLYTAFVLVSQINIGVRYYLPAYGFLCILGGALLARALKSQRLRPAGAIISFVFIGWIGVEALRTYPNHMSYMNQLARGANWWYLSDSNVEWGEDAPEVARYLIERGETRVRSAFLGDFMLLRHYGVQPLVMTAADADPTEKTRYVAIGASFLNGSTVPGSAAINGRQATETERQNFFDSYRHRIPEAVIGGGSVYLYRDDH